MKEITLILLLGITAGWLAKRYGQPAAVAQVLVGVIFGPPLLGWIESIDKLQILGEIGVVLLLAMAGMKLGLHRLAEAGWLGFWVAFLGMIFCFVGGFALASWWGSPDEEAIYVGVALTATSIGISVQVLQQYNLIGRDIGNIVVAAAVIDDIIALYLLAIAHGGLSEDMALSQIMVSMLTIALLLVGIIMICRWSIKWLFTESTPASFRLLVTIVLIMIFAWLTELTGYSMVVGGFFASLGISEGISEHQRKMLIQQYEPLILILVPFYFVFIGGRAEWQVLADEGMTLLVTGLIMIAILGKSLGGFIGSLSIGRVIKSLLIGFSMTPRGEVALIIAGIGFEQGHISHHVLVALVLMTIAAALIGPLLIALLVRL